MFCKADTPVFAIMYFGAQIFTAFFFCVTLVRQYFSLPNSRCCLMYLNRETQQMLEVPIQISIMYSSHLFFCMQDHRSRYLPLFLEDISTAMLTSCVLSHVVFYLLELRFLSMLDGVLLKARSSTTSFSACLGMLLICSPE